MLQVRVTTTNRIPSRSFSNVQNQHQGDEHAKAAGMYVLPLRRHHLFPSSFGKRLTEKECMLLVGPELGGELASVSISIFLSFCLSGRQKSLWCLTKKKKKKHFPPLCSALLHIKETISGKRKTVCRGRKVSSLYLQNYLKTIIFYIAYYTFFLCERCARG